MLFDSHCHLNDRCFNSYRDKLAQEIASSEVSYVVDVGYDLASSAKAVKNAEKYDFCYAAVGCHPHNVKDFDDEQLLLLKGLAAKKKVVAIGEMGLDYYRDLSPRDVQGYWFRRQIELALELKMPIIIHDRDANADVLSILKEEGVFSKDRKASFPARKDGSGDARLLMHCYSGSSELASQYVRLGATISIAGPVTYKNARRAVEVVRDIDLDFILIETDAPYLALQPVRGKTNTPLNVRYVAEKIAEIKGISYEAAAETTCENAKRFFDI